MKTAKNQESTTPKPRRWLVSFKCPVCLVTRSGWLTQDDYAPRVCVSCYGPMAALGQKRRMPGQGEVCGAIMDTITDERPYSKMPIAEPVGGLGRDGGGFNGNGY